MARVIGIVGIIWPKVSFDLIDNPKAEIFYIFQVHGPYLSREIISDGEKVALAKISKRKTEVRVKIINGKIGPYGTLTKIEKMVLQEAIEIFKTKIPWKGVDYTGGKDANPTNTNNPK
jgi:hypothetical protein